MSSLDFPSESLAFSASNNFDVHSQLAWFSKPWNSNSENLGSAHHHGLEIYPEKSSGAAELTSKRQGFLRKP